MATKIAMIGLGVVGERIIKQALTNENYKIVAIYDEHTERLQKIANQYKLPAKSSVDDLLMIATDWVYIGTPPASHAILTEKIAAKGYHVLSEKPLAQDMTEGRKMLEAVNEAGVKSAMHFPLMYSKEVRKLKEVLQNKELGDILRIELHAQFPQWPRIWQQNQWIACRQQGGFIREIFPHYLQLTNHLFGGIDIISHDTVYPNNPNLSEQSVIGIARTLKDIPMLISGLVGSGQQELIEYKVFGTKKTMTLRNWSELFEAGLDTAEQRVVIHKEEESLLQACHQLIQGETALVISFEEGLKVQYWLDELLR